MYIYMYACTCRNSCANLFVECQPIHVCVGGHRSQGLWREREREEKHEMRRERASEKKTAPESKSEGKSARESVRERNKTTGME